MGLARCGTVFPMSAVVGAAVPAAVYRWGLWPCCPGVGRCLSGVNNHRVRRGLTRGILFYLSWGQKLRSLRGDPAEALRIPGSRGE